MKHLLALLLIGLLAMSACQKAVDTTETKAMLQSMIDEVWNQGALDKADEFCAADYIRHNPKSMEPTVPSEIQGLEEFKAYVTEVRTTYPDFKVDVQDIVVEGDMVAVRWTVSGTHKDYDKQISLDGISLMRFAEGKAAEEWASWDVHGLMQQLGMVPQQETTMK